MTNMKRHKMNDIITMYIPGPSGAPECSVQIIEIDNVFELTWGDMVANEWTETYDSLAAALSRVALLAECADANWAPGFAHEPEAHVDAWTRFASESLS